MIKDNFTAAWRNGWRKGSFLLFLAFVCLGKASKAQCDTTSTIRVTLSITKEYEVKLPKSDFLWETEIGELNIKTDSVSQKWYDIDIVIHNNSTDSIFIWLMTCSWIENFIVNNNYISLGGHLSCLHNVPELVPFKPNETRIYQTTLRKSIKFENPCRNCIYGPQVEATKLGLIVIDDLHHPKLTPFFRYQLAMEDKSTWNVVWSNSLFLLSKGETSALLDAL